MIQPYIAGSWSCMRQAKHQLPAMHTVGLETSCTTLEQAALYRTSLLRQRHWVWTLMTLRSKMQALR